MPRRGVDTWDEAGAVELGLDDVVQLRAFAFPLAFLENGDIASCCNAQVSRDTAQNATMLLQNAIPLSSLGTIVPLLAFEPADHIMGAVFAYQASKGVATGSQYIRVVKVEQRALSDDSSEFRITIQDNRLTPSDMTFYMVKGVNGWSSPTPVK